MTRYPSSSVLTTGPDKGPVLLMAHGAGAGMQHEFMQNLADALAKRDTAVLRFNFAYMQRMVAESRRRPPGAISGLQDEFTRLIESITDRPVFIGGKSMGGRVASLIADSCCVQGLVMVGFPFHPVGRPTSFRGEHLAELKTPALLLQGDRDKFGDRLEVENYTLSSRVRIHWIADGDHGLKPRASSGLTLESNLDSAADFIAAFMQELTSQSIS